SEAVGELCGVGEVVVVTPRSSTRSSRVVAAEGVVASGGNVSEPGPAEQAIIVRAMIPSTTDRAAEAVRMGPVFHAEGGGHHPRCLFGAAPGRVPTFFRRTLNRRGARWT